MYNPIVSSVQYKTNINAGLPRLQAAF